MAEVTSYAHGVPSWVDIGTELPGALEFYTGLFGWEAQDMGEDMGHYTTVSKAAKMVAGFSTAQDPGPPHWTMYVNVDDVDEVAGRVEPAGGRVVFGPADVVTAGRMAVFTDPTGAVVAAWQPKEHLGAQLVNEPGAFIWAELHTSDPERAKAFYGEVFSWGWGGSEHYAEVQVGGRSVAGLSGRPEQMPKEAPDAWLVYFGSADVDADAAKVSELGGSVLAGPADIPDTGRFAVCADPQRAAFGIFQSS